VLIDTGFSFLYRVYSACRAGKMSIMAVATLPSQELPQELIIYRAAHVKQDIALLQRGSSHLRKFAWFLLFPAAFGGFATFLLMLMNPNPTNVVLFIAMGLLLLIAFFYFSISSYIRRARRWAVYTALVMATITGFFTALDLFLPFHRRTPVSVLITCLYVIMHLNTIKDLLHCLGAIDRITWAASLRFKKAHPQEEKAPWES
jgi:hypothetical protein